MIPKSVSVSTRIVALGAVLLIPAWGWATEFEKRFKIVDSSDNELVTCTSDVLSSCRVDGLEKHLACEQHMREAMWIVNSDMILRQVGKLDSYISDPLLMTARERNLWISTIKDCVEGR